MKEFFNTGRFLTDHWTSSLELATFLNRYGYPVSPAAVYKWWIRSTIPAAYLPVLLALLELDGGAPVAVAAYLNDR